jgi:16S rRNA (cytosine1402-N4)-methyltransferase
VAIERLQVAQDEYHVPVLEAEITELISSLPAGIVIDATLGGAGHSVALLKASNTVKIIGIDRDPEARAEAQRKLAPFAGRFVICDATFAEIEEVVAREAAFINELPIVAILMDLGVSSHQLDDASRGFSFRADAPLDMRMNPTTGVTAAEFIAAVDPHEFARLLRENGETRFAGAIAKSVIERRPQTTNELTEAVERAVPMAARRRGHVATRAFQALRIAVNAEEMQLDEGLRGAMNVLSPAGVLIVISYHSGEDRVVKAYFQELASGGCTCPAHLPCVCGAVPTATVFKASAQLASPAEIERNPRARSARLRIARKVSA